MNCIDCGRDISSAFPDYMSNVNVRFRCDACGQSKTPTVTVAGLKASGYDFSGKTGKKPLVAFERKATPESDGA